MEWCSMLYVAVSLIFLFVCGIKWPLFFQYALLCLFIDTTSFTFCTHLICCKIDAPRSSTSGTKQLSKYFRSNRIIYLAKDLFRFQKGR